jgi:putative hydrolase of the HAD superfamily
MSDARPDALVSDFGGVLTSPLVEAFAGLQARDGVPLEALGRAMASIAARDGANPLHELESGRLSEAEFLGRLEAVMAGDLGRPVSLHGFAETFFAGLHPNERLFAYYRTLRERGIALALCTNNVREWEARWRGMLPIDEIFDVVVDSGFVGVRKPERRIYELTLARLDRTPERVVFVDDVEANVQAACELGMHGLRFAGTDEAIAAIDRLLFG